jgi:hypothetical protein|tara:strand:+ start:234 stop:479 length:246 start_codon:yes stop_codon:yes gene_type:complete
MICEHKECLLNKKENSINDLIDLGCSEILQNLQKELPLFDDRCLKKVLAERLKLNGQFYISELIIKETLTRNENNEKETKI